MLRHSSEWYEKQMHKNIKLELPVIDNGTQMCYLVHRRPQNRCTKHIQLVKHTSQPLVASTFIHLRMRVYTNAIELNAKSAT